MGYFKNTDIKLKELLAKNPVYTRSAYPGFQLGTAQNTLMSRIPGMDQYLRGKDATYGTQLSNINKNATDASQALALGAAAGGERDSVSDNMLGMQMDWKKFGLSNLNDAYGAMTNEDRYVNENKQTNFQNEVSLEGARAANKFAKRKALWNTVGGIAQLGAGLFTGGATSAASGFANLFKKGGGAGSGIGSTASYPGHTI